MSRISNMYIYGNKETIDRLAEEYEMLGYTISKEKGRLTVFSRQKKKEKTKNKKSTRTKSYD